MAANETTIEAHIGFLRSDLSDVKQDVRKLTVDSTTIQTTLRDKIDQSHAALSAGQAALSDRINRGFETLNARIDAGDKEIRERIDAGDKELRERIGAVDQRLGGRIDALGEKIDNLGTAFAELRGFHKTVLWVCGGVVTAVTVALSVGKSFGWF